jgi:hypothetical protein
LVPGNISAAKGAKLLREMVAVDGGHRVEFHVLGDPGDLEAMPGLVLHGRYARDRFLEHAAAIGADIGAVLSVWPETYSHTVTELWAAGLPVFGLDLGAVGERIRASGGGWLTAYRDAASILEALAALDPWGPEIEERRAAVRAWQDGIGIARDVHAMAFDYDVLYREVAHRQRAFFTPFAAPLSWRVVDLRREGVSEAPGAFANRPGGPVVFSQASPEALPALLAAGDTTGVAVLCDTARESHVASIADLCRQHGVAFALSATCAADDAAAQHLPDFLVDPAEPAVAVQARIAMACARAPTALHGSLKADPVLA